MRFTTAAATLIVGIGLVSAQSISDQCKTALANVVASPDAKCLNPAGLVAIYTQNANTSLVDPINNWLTGLCAQPACSNATLATLTTNVTTGCSAELSSLGIQANDTATLIGIVQAVYPVVRQIVCLKDTSANQLCVTEALTGIQTSYGTLSAAGIEKFIEDLYSGSTTIPKDIICSNCTKASYNILKKNVPPDYLTDITGNFTTECGSSFVDGADPSGISQTANSGTGSL